MASPNALIVEVVGDTSDLTNKLAKADKDLQRFAGRASSWDKRRTPQQQAADFLGDLPERQKKLADDTAAAEARLASQRATMVRTAAGAGVAGLALHVLGTNMNELGGNAGKLGGALQDLTTGNVVGFVKGLQSINAADPAKIAADLLKMADAAKATRFANDAAAIGLDNVAEAARKAAAQIQAANDAFVDSTKIRDSTSPGVIAGEVSKIPLPKPRPGISRGQRNTFFDDALTRELDRAQDNVSALRKIAAEIQAEINARDDITRKLTLTDRLVDVQRRIETVQTRAAAEAARLAKERADAEERRLAELKRAAAARLQARDDLALGLQTPGAPNLRRQLDQLSSRTDIGSISSRLASALEGARRILSRKSKDINEETRSNIASLFETIRRELNKGATSGGPLTKTTQLSERILAGLGLSDRDERLLRARISHFNSAGVALAGTGTGSGGGINLTSYTVIDGQKVATTSAKYNRRTMGMNPSPRNGPNAGGYTGRG